MALVPQAPAESVPVWTVDEAGKWLQSEGLPLDLRRQLGKDCSMVCRIHNQGWRDKVVYGQDWSTERAYTREVLLEVFKAHPVTRPLLEAKGWV